MNEWSARAEVEDMRIKEKKLDNHSIRNSFHRPIRTLLRERYTKTSETISARKSSPSPMTDSNSNSMVRKQRKALAEPNLWAQEASPNKKVRSRFPGVRNTSQPFSSAGKSTVCPSIEAEQCHEDKMEISMENDNRYNVANVRSIIKAWYGRKVNKWTEHQGYDVTDLVREYLIGTTLLTAKLDFGDFGEDPAPNERKVLLVLFRSVPMKLLSSSKDLKCAQVNTALKGDTSSGSDIQGLSSAERNVALQKAVVEQYWPQDIIGVSESCLQGFYGSDNAHRRRTAADVTEELLSILEGNTLRLSKWSNLDVVFPYFDSRDHGRRSLILNYLPYRPKTNQLRSLTSLEPVYSSTPYLNTETIKEHNCSNTEEDGEIESIVEFETRSRVAEVFEHPNIQELGWQLGHKYRNGHVNVTEVHKENGFLDTVRYAEGDVCEGYSNGVWSKVKILNTNADGSYNIRWLKNNKKTLFFMQLRPIQHTTKDVSSLNEHQLYEWLIQLHIPEVYAKMLLDCHVTGNDLQSMDHSDLDYLGIKNSSLRDKIFSSVR